MLELCAPKGVIEIVKCGCNRTCTVGKCYCLMNSLVCTLPFVNALNVTIQRSNHIPAPTVVIQKRICNIPVPYIHVNAVFNNSALQLQLFIFHLNILSVHNGLKTLIYIMCFICLEIYSNLIT